MRWGEHLTLLGPSGCGKTITLRAIAGLEQPSAGEIRIGGQVVYSSTQRVNVPAEKRGVSMVFQSYAIWPHMTVFDNVAYGLRVRRLGKKDIAEKVHWALGLVRLGDLAQRSAAQLSGGSSSVWRSPAALRFLLPLFSSMSPSQTSMPSCAPKCG